MKLLKTLAICFLCFITLGLTSCNNSFCTDDDAKAIQEQMLINFNSDEIANKREGTDGFKNFSDKAEKSWYDMIAQAEKDMAEGKEVNLDQLKKDKVAEIYKNEHPKACLTLKDTKDPTTGAPISGKTWGDAFGKYGGFIEGLLVYPIAALLIGLTSVTTPVLGIILGTFIIRLAVVLLTYKQTLASQKIQMLQPEMNAINNKYLGKDDTNSKNRKAMEMMDLYKKYDINPLTSMIGPFLTLPIFISIYGAVQASTVLRDGEIFGVSLGQTLSSGILSWNWFAIVLFLLMIATQFLSMKVPTWIANRKTRHHGNPNEKNPTDSTQTIMTYVMLFMIVFVGWMLPISMTIYWVTSSVFSILQSIAMQNIKSKPKHPKKEEHKSVLDQIRGN